MAAAIMEITDATLKARYAESVLAALPEWFGIPESTKEYVDTVHRYPFWAAVEDGRCIGFFSARIHYGRTGDIYVCGIVPERHGQGLGTALYREAEAWFRREGCRYAMVLTLSESSDDPSYAKTRLFYRHLGFAELVELPELWDERNPCLVMVKSL